MKDIDYYMNLPWKIELEKIPFVEGGGFNASIPSLGSLVYVARGGTEQEALKELQRITRMLFEKNLREGITIEEPK